MHNVQCFWDWLRRGYVRYRFMDKVVEAKDRENPRIAALLRPRFDHLPPTLFIVAECDIIRDDSYGQTDWQLADLL